MADVVGKATRSRMMAGIRGRDTKPELLVRRYLHATGLRFRLKSKLPGKPDLVFPKYGTVVFVHGCFWHRHLGCRYAATPSTNESFWTQKFLDNVARDKRVQGELRNANWRVIVVWECEISPRKLGSLAKRIIRSAA